MALLAQTFGKDGLHGLAYNLWHAAARYKKPDAAVLNNMGLAAASIGSQPMQEEAERYLRQSLQLEPGNLPSLNNLALMALHSGDYEQCLKLCEKSLKQDPGQPEVHECRAYALLMIGNWEEGWKEWDYSLGTKYRPHIGTEPYWEGQKGVKLLIRGEQGIGDEISFGSVLPDVAKDCEVTLECDYRLEGLFKRSFPNIDVQGTRVGEKRGSYTGHDYRALVGSLCRHYRNTPESFPGTPYLVADPERRLQWRALLDTFPGKKIGIAWTGGRTNTFADRRSFRLEEWRPILDTGHTFVSLQYKNPGSEAAALGVKHWPRATETTDYDDTAALVAELDLVIATTTAVVHLAGALGKECWCLVPKKPRWFHQKEGKRIPWYKSVEIFRQTKQGWPIQEIADRL